MTRTENPDGAPSEHWRGEGPLVRSGELATHSAANDWLHQESGLRMGDLRRDPVPRGITGPPIADDVD